MRETEQRWRAAWKQDAEVGPVAQRILFENDRVRVWEIVLEPGQELALHTHLLDYLVVSVETSQMEAREHTGQLRQVEPQPGDVSWTSPGDGQTHSLINKGSQRYVNRLIELK